MSDAKFAVAIVFPGADMMDVVQAALVNNVHIIDKETYSLETDYVHMYEQYRSNMEDIELCFLFVFAGSQPMLVRDSAGLELAIERGRTVNN